MEKKRSDRVFVVFIARERYDCFCLDLLARSFSLL